MSEPSKRSPVWIRGISSSDALPTSVRLSMMELVSLSSKWLNLYDSYSTPIHASHMLSLHDLSEKSNSALMRYFDGSSSRVQRLQSTTMTNTAEKDWPATWKAFDTAWDRMCKYHRDQAISISKAKSEGLYTTEEAMSELRGLREERERCDDCRVKPN